MGFLFMRLKPPNERPPIDQIAQQYMFRFSSLPDGLCAGRAMPVLKISSGADSTAAGSDYGYLLMGLDRDTVYKTSLELEREIRGIPGKTYVLQQTADLAHTNDWRVLGALTLTNTIQPWIDTQYDTNQPMRFYRAIHFP